MYQSILIGDLRPRSASRRSPLRLVLSASASASGSRRFRIAIRPPRCRLPVVAARVSVGRRGIDWPAASRLVAGHAAPATQHRRGSCPRSPADVRSTAIFVTVRVAHSPVLQLAAITPQSNNMSSRESPKQIVNAQQHAAKPKITTITTIELRINSRPRRPGDLVHLRFDGDQEIGKRRQVDQRDNVSPHRSPATSQRQPTEYAERPMLQYSLNRHAASTTTTSSAPNVTCRAIRPWLRLYKPD